MPDTPSKSPRAKSLKTVLTRQEFKRLDALFQTKALVREMQEGERLLVTFVGDARKHGATWQEVADSLGVTQQAATAKYGPLLKGEPSRQRARAGRSPRVPVRREEQQSLAV